MEEVFDIKNDTITISIPTYTRLLLDAEFLSYLKAAGVGAWDGYDVACDLMEEDNKF